MHTSDHGHLSTHPGCTFTTLPRLKYARAGTAHVTRERPYVLLPPAHKVVFCILTYTRPPTRGTAYDCRFSQRARFNPPVQRLGNLAV